MTSEKRSIPINLPLLAKQMNELRMEKKTKAGAIGKEIIQYIITSEGSTECMRCERTAVMSSSILSWVSMSMQICRLKNTKEKQNNWT